jgi:DNA polymerase III subunit epsilon
LGQAHKIAVLFNELTKRLLLKFYRFSVILRVSMNYRPIYYDTETTGIRSQVDKIIEIAAYDPVADKSFNALINPGIPIPAEAQKIHNISDEMVKEAPDFAEIISRFIEFCSGDVVLIAHNNDAFDRPFLESELQRSNLSMPDWPFIDSLKWARKYRSDLPRHNLQFLREIYGIEANQAHRALDDVITLYRIFDQMIDDLPLEEVIALLSKKNKIDRMPFGKHQGKLLNEVPKNYIQWLLKEGAFDKPENAALKESFEQLGILNS